VQIHEGQIALICSYSYYRAHILNLFIKQFQKEFPHSEILLWAYDKVHNDLANYTVGSGGGDRLPNLKHLSNLANSKYLLAIDDDVYITSGKLSSLIKAHSKNKHTLVMQPALDKRGYYTFPITVFGFRRGFKVTNFTEVGPVIFCEKKSFNILFIDDFKPRGVGLEWYWASRFSKACLIGINFSVRILHSQKPGKSDYPEESEFLNRIIKHYNIKNFPPLPPEALRLLIRFTEKFLTFSKTLTVDNFRAKDFALFDPKKVYIFSLRRLYFYLPCKHLVNWSPFKLVITQKCPECGLVLALSR